MSANDRCLRESYPLQLSYHMFLSALIVVCSIISHNRQRNENGNVCSRRMHVRMQPLPSKSEAKTWIVHITGIHGISLVVAQACGCYIRAHTVEQGRRKNNMSHIFVTCDANKSSCQRSKSLLPNRQTKTDNSMYMHHMGAQKDRKWNAYTRCAIEKLSILLYHPFFGHRIFLRTRSA